MSARVAPMLAVADPAAAIEFYTRAFGAEVVWELGNASPMVACVEIDGAEFFLAASRRPPTCAVLGVQTRSALRPYALSCSSTIPRRPTAGLLPAGATDAGPVQEHTHTTSGKRPFTRMLQGSVIDPAGHLWLIGRFLE